MAELVLSLCELAEAEGRVLRDNIRRTGSGCLLSATGLLFLAAALALLTVALYHLLRYVVSTPVAFLCLAGICAAFGCLILLLARLKPKKPRPGNVPKHEKS